MQTRKRTVWIASIGLLFITIASGCIKSKMPDPGPAETYVSVMHLAPTSPSLDVYFGAEKVSSTPFTPGSVSGSYNRIDRGSYAINFKKGASDSLVASIPMALYDTMRYYTLLVFNQAANGPVQALRIEDDYSTVVLTKPVYRFFHMSPNTVAIDLYMDNVKIESGRTPIDNVQQLSLNTFRETSTGLHFFQVKAAGTDNVLLTRSDVELGAGNAYTLFLKGLTGGSGSNELSLGVLRAAN